MTSSDIGLKLGISLTISILSTAACALADDHFADNGFGKPVSTMQHPCAEHYKGVTYIAYQGPREDPFVCAFRHATREWSGPFKAGTSQLGKMPAARDARAIDNHGRPALIVDGKGFVHLVFGGHGGSWLHGHNPLGTPGAGRQTHVVSKYPEDISAWEVLDNIPPSGTYSQFAKMPDGDIYLFYRHGSHRSDWVFQKSNDDARTFAPPVPVLKHKPQTADPNVHDAWYAWFHESADDTIAATFIHHPCAVIGHQKPRYNGYYMKMECADDSWENVRGLALSMPLTKEAADEHAMMYDTGEDGVRTGVCHLDADGKPHVLIKKDARQVYSRWTGDAWQEPVPITTAPISQAGDFARASELILSQNIEGKAEICRWATKDGGLHWERGDTLLSVEHAELLISSHVRNAHPEARVIAAAIGPDPTQLERKMYLVGDHGTVGRERALK